MQVPLENCISLRQRWQFYSCIIAISTTLYHQQLFACARFSQLTVRHSNSLLGNIRRCYVRLQPWISQFALAYCIVGVVACCSTTYNNGPVDVAKMRWHQHFSDKQYRYLLASQMFDHVVRHSLDSKLWKCKMNITDTIFDIFESFYRIYFADTSYKCVWSIERRSIDHRSQSVFYENERKYESCHIRLQCTWIERFSIRVSPEIKSHSTNQNSKTIPWIGIANRKLFYYINPFTFLYDPFDIPILLWSFRKVLRQQSVFMS